MMGGRESEAFFLLPPLMGDWHTFQLRESRNGPAVSGWTWIPRGLPRCMQLNSGKGH